MKTIKPFFVACIMLGFLSISSNADNLIPRINDIPDEDALFCIDQAGNMYFVVTRIGKTSINIQYANNKVKRKTIKTDSSNEEDDKYKKPIVLDAKNIKSLKNGFALLYKYDVVQFFDDNLNVVKYLTGLDILHHYIQTSFAFTIQNDENTYLLGEKGEVLALGKNGKAIKRLVFKGLFNESRIIEPREPDSLIRSCLMSSDPLVRNEGERSLDNLKFEATRQNERLAARDKLLPAPVFIKGDELPQSIKAMESRGNGNIIILDGEMTDKEKEKLEKGEMVYRFQKLYELNPETAEIKVLNIPKFRLLRKNIEAKKEKGNEIKDDDIWQDEIIIDIRCKNDVLCILTNYRALTVEFAPELRVTGESHFYHEDEKYNNIAWDVTYTKPVKFLFVNLEECRIDECTPVPEKVGTPLDRGFAEDEKKEKEMERLEILAEEEIERRDENWQDNGSISDNDKKLFELFMRDFLDSLIKKDLKKCESFFHEDFIYDKTLNKARFVDEELPDFIDIDMLGEIISIDVVEGLYGNKEKTIVKITYEFRASFKDGENEEKGKLEARLIKENNQWLFYDF